MAAASACSWSQRRDGICELPEAAATLLAFSALYETGEPDECAGNGRCRNHRHVAAQSPKREGSRGHGLGRFVFCSSVSVYFIVDKTAITEDTPLRPTSVYGASKVAGEQLVQAFTAEYGLSGVSLRIGRVYGPYRRGNCHLATLIRDAAAGETTEIPCDPEFLYHYVYVDDVVEAQITALTVDEFSFSAYNVGSGEALTMPQIAEIARAAIPGANPTLVAGADDVPDVQTAFDVSRIAADLAWRPRFDLASGLRAHQRALRPI